MSFAVGTFGLDNANTVDYGAAYARGARFQMRYSAGMGNANSGTAFKLCKPGEIATVVAAGMDFVANSEWSTDRVTLGAGAGAQDGAADLAFWQSRGLAKGSSVYVSWDAAPNPSLYNAVHDYLEAYGNALEHYYCDGLYAGIPALNEMAGRGVIKHGWIPEAPSWSVPNSPIAATYAPPAHTLWDLWQPTPSQVAPASGLLASMLNPSLVSCIWQTGNHWPNGSDENVIVRSGPLGSHLEASQPKTTGETEMLLAAINAGPNGEEPGIYLLGGPGGYAPLVDQADAASFLNAGVAQIAINYVQHLAFLAVTAATPGASVSAADIAKAVNDDAAKRMQS